MIRTFRRWYSALKPQLISNDTINFTKLPDLSPFLSKWKLIEAKDYRSIQLKLQDLEKEAKDDRLWQNFERQIEVNKQIAEIKNDLFEYENLVDSWNGNISLLQMAEQEKDAGLLDEVLHDLNENFLPKLSNFALESMMTGEADKQGCYIELNPGAGGRESSDFCSMLMRMYQKWGQKKKFDVAVIDEQVTEDDTFKSVTLEIKGPYAYGWLKNEFGTHRLVRNSPFDVKQKRHTSFVSVSVTPRPDVKNDEDLELQIPKSDLKVDVMRSSGKGGQNVNKTESAVRLTHIPSGIVVKVSQERSQFQNRKIAMNLLLSKLQRMEIEKRDLEKTSLHENHSMNTFGSQIRSYVLTPYQLVKDTRTQFSDGNVNDMFEGGDVMDRVLESLLLKNQ